MPKYSNVFLGPRGATHNFERVLDALGNFMVLLVLPLKVTAKATAAQSVRQRRLANSV